MTKREFLKELEDRLQMLDEKERKDMIEEYSQHISGGREVEPRFPLQFTKGPASVRPFFRRRHSQEVRQRSAKPLSPVRFRVSPPFFSKPVP